MQMWSLFKIVRMLRNHAFRFCFALLIKFSIKIRNIQIGYFCDKINNAQLKQPKERMLHMTLCKLQI